MKQQRTWATIHFTKGDAEIELTINYKTHKYTMTHGSNDDFVRFNSNGDSNLMREHLDRLKCVEAALKYVQKELQILPKDVVTHKSQYNRP